VCCIVRTNRLRTQAPVSVRALQGIVVVTPSRVKIAPLMNTAPAMAKKHPVLQIPTVGRTQVQQGSVPVRWDSQAPVAVIVCLAQRIPSVH
jgi:hypothetical protein